MHLAILADSGRTELHKEFVVIKRFLDMIRAGELHFYTCITLDFNGIVTIYLDTIWTPKRLNTVKSYEIR